MINSVLKLYLTLKKTVMLTKFYFFVYITTKSVLKKILISAENILTKKMSNCCMKNYFQKYC